MKYKCYNLVAHFSQLQTQFCRYYLFFLSVLKFIHSAVMCFTGLELQLLLESNHADGGTVVLTVVTVLLLS